MGFRPPGLIDAYDAIRRSFVEISSPYNDGYTSEYCKKELWRLKTWLEEEYSKLPEFGDEKSWEQELLIDKLKQKE